MILRAEARSVVADVREKLAWELVLVGDGKGAAAQLEQLARHLEAALAGRAGPAAETLHARLWDTCSKWGSALEQSAGGEEIKPRLAGARDAYGRASSYATLLCTAQPTWARICMELLSASDLVKLLRRRRSG